MIGVVEDFERTVEAMAANIEMKFVRVYCEVCIVGGDSLEACRDSIGHKWMCWCMCGKDCRRRLVMKNVVVWGGKRRGGVVTSRVKRRKICGLRRTPVVVPGRQRGIVYEAISPASSAPVMCGDDVALLSELSDLVVSDVFDMGDLGLSDALLDLASGSGE